jgi:small subunit ribosomal protein S16
LTPRSPLENRLLRIRLRRTGKKKQPSYRVVVADQRAPRDGDFVEIVGHYNPRTEPTTLELDEDRVRHWLGQGAQPSETVHRLLHKQGIYEVEPPKRVTRPSRAERQAAQAAAAEAEAEPAAEAPASDESGDGDATEGSDD